MGIACKGRPGAGTSAADRGGATRMPTIDALANRPLQRPKPRKSPKNLEAHSGSALRCIIDQQFTASPLNGTSLDNRDRGVGRSEFWQPRTWWPGTVAMKTMAISVVRTAGTATQFTVGRAVARPATTGLRGRECLSGG